MHPKTMLLVDDRQPEIGEGDFILHQRMGANGDMDRAAREAFQRGPPFAFSLGCSTGVFSTVQSRRARKSARKSPASPS